MKINRRIPVVFQKVKQYSSEETDIRFQRVKIWLMHLGENFNGSYFSKEVVEEAIPTLANTPILAYIEQKENGQLDFSDHRIVLTKKDGETTVKYLGKAIGVIPENNNAQFEDRLCDDGQTRTFLTVDGLLWTKFDDSIDIMNRDSIKGQSMELSEDYEGDFGDDNLFHFSKFKFFGACGLGFNVEPAMKNSTIELQFTYDSVRSEINNRIEQFKKYFSMESNETPINKNKYEEVQVVEKHKKEIAAKFSLTANQLYDELSRVLNEVKFTTENWYGDEVEVSKYYLRDYDENFVYAVNRQEGYIDVKIPYSMNGDNPVFDLNSVTRIKYVPQDWEGSEDEDVVENNFSIKLVEEAKKSFEALKKDNKNILQKLSEKEDAFINLSEQFSAIKDELTESKREVESLSKFKKEKETQERKDKIDSIFAKYAKHLNKEEIETLRVKESLFDKYEDFEREIKSYVCDKLLVDNRNDVSNTVFNRMGLPPENGVSNSTESTSVWDRLSKNKQ
ncbi:hypothetical protein [Paenibacillus oleatilyticus]|uniref:hypothetical protein n=1 Tax=Paenibacillus oleatilyticus TaxID=2594886 RepID=UPI001C1FADA6|nr:hypothetical protein [Paenibacillus oleatilyticus]MBU7316137.1 hypothetical protein [Paenibacillus oleatilyticus]